MSRSGKGKNEVFNSQACSSAIIQSLMIIMKERRTEDAGRNNAKDHCPCYEVFQTDCGCVEESHKDVSGTQKSRKEGVSWKITVKKLMGQDIGASSIEITNKNIKSFERVAKKYNVDFAVKKDRSTKPPKYIVFFKGRDADVITQDFKDYVRVNEKKQNRVSVREKLAAFREILTKGKNRERAREHQKDRGR